MGQGRICSYKFTEINVPKKWRSGFRAKKAYLKFSQVEGMLRLFWSISLPIRYHSLLSSYFLYFTLILSIKCSSGNSSCSNMLLPAALRDVILSFANLVTGGLYLHVFLLSPLCSDYHFSLTNKKSEKYSS